MNPSPQPDLFAVGWLVLLVTALLIFGRRLPEVARSVRLGFEAFLHGLQVPPDSHRHFPYFILFIFLLILLLCVSASPW